MTTEPTDAELKAMWRLHAADIGGIFYYARAVLAKWGTPAPADSLVGDSERLAWMADGWTQGHEKLYVQHVLKTGGVGDVDDLRTFIDKQMAAQKDTP